MVFSLLAYPSRDPCLTYQKGSPWALKASLVQASRPLKGISFYFKRMRTGLGHFACFLLLLRLSRHLPLQAALLSLSFYLLFQLPPGLHQLLVQVLKRQQLATKA